MTTSQTTPITAEAERPPAFYVEGPLAPDSLAAALRLAYTTAASDRDHDVYTLIDVMNEDHHADLEWRQFAQVARAVLYVLLGIGALEVHDPLDALQRWQARNRGVTTLQWAIGETVSTISAEDRQAVAGTRARGRREKRSESDRPDGHTRSV
jgi:hypothetical protein